MAADTERASGFEKAVVIGIGLAVGWIFMGMSDRVPLGKLSSNPHQAHSVGVLG